MITDDEACVMSSTVIYPICSMCFCYLYGCTLASKEVRLFPGYSPCIYNAHQTSPGQPSLSRFSVFSTFSYQLYPCRWFTNSQVSNNSICKHTIASTSNWLAANLNVISPYNSPNHSNLKRRLLRLHHPIYYHGTHKLLQYLSSVLFTKVYRCWIV